MIRYLKNNPVPAFDPDTIQILCRALDVAWQTIDTNRAAFKIDGNAERAREVLAKQIVDLAKRGERDPRSLIEGALARLKL
jgi:hypothetical protein